MLQGHVTARCAGTTERVIWGRCHVGRAAVTPPLATIINAVIQLE